MNIHNAERKIKHALILAGRYTLAGGGGDCCCCCCCFSTLGEEAAGLSGVSKPSWKMKPLGA
jgi:hypothetical protein